MRRLEPSRRSFRREASLKVTFMRAMVEREAVVSPAARSSSTHLPSSSRRERSWVFSAGCKGIGFSFVVADFCVRPLSHGQRGRRQRSAPTSVNTLNVGFHLLEREIVLVFGDAEREEAFEEA